MSIDPKGLLPRCPVCRVQPSEVRVERTVDLRVTTFEPCGHTVTDGVEVEPRYVAARDHLDVNRWRLRLSCGHAVDFTGAIAPARIDCPVCLGTAGS